MHQDTAVTSIKILFQDMYEGTTKGDKAEGAIHKGNKISQSKNNRVGRETKMYVLTWPCKTKGCPNELNDRDFTLRKKLCMVCSDKSRKNPMNRDRIVKLLQESPKTRIQITSTLNMSDWSFRSAIWKAKHKHGYIIKYNRGSKLYTYGGKIK